jgi:U3 small nucleolar RNA-associated protein 18
MEPELSDEQGQGGNRHRHPSAVRTRRTRPSAAAARFLPRAVLPTMPKQKAQKAQRRKLDEKLRLPRGERGGDSLAQIEAREARELQAAAPDAEELALEAELFGGTAAAAAEGRFGGDAGDGGGEAADASSEDEGIGGAWPARLAGIGMGAGNDSDDGAEEADGDRDSLEAEEGGSDLREMAGLPAQKRAWVDEDDEDVVVDLSAVNRLRKLRKSENEKEISGVDFAQRLREQHRKLHPGVEWSAKAPARRKRRATVRVEQLDGSDSDTERAAADSLSDEDEDESDEDADPEELFADVTRRAGGSVTVEGKPRRLPPDELGVKRATNANAAAVSKCVVQSVEFHRNSQLMLTAGFDQCLRLFSVDGLRNPVTQQVYLKDMPIHTACFTPDGNSVVMTGRRKFFYTYDLQRATIQRVPRIVGRDEKSLEKFAISPDNKWIAFLGDAGYILLCSNQTKGWVASLKMEGSVRCVTFSPDSSTLISGGDNGELFHWDLRTRRCRHRHADAGMSPLTCLDYSDTGQYLACGSRSGVVNVYDMTQPIRGSQPAPTATIDNLTTPVSSVRFNHDAQVRSCHASSLV